MNTIKSIFIGIGALWISSTYGAITTVTVSNTGSSSTPAAAPITFAHVFAPGDIPAGSSVALSAAGTTLPAQVDAKAFHPDGSLRHAIITTQTPAMSGGATLTVNLDKTPTPAATTAVSLPALLASNFDSKIDVSLAGVHYSASAKTLLSKAVDRTWLQGPLVSEWHASGPLLDSLGNTHPHLSAQFYVRAYSGLNPVRVDVVLENNWAYQSNPSNLTYDVNVSLNGTSVYSKSVLTHYHHARWHQVFWSAPQPALAIKYNVPYWLDTKALPNYDRTLVVPESTLVSWDNQWKTAAAKGLMQEGLLQAYMPTTGARDDIGPLPGWSAVYWLSQDARVKAATLGTGDLAGSWSIHYRDQKTQLPVSLTDYPYATTQVSSSDAINPATGKSEEMSRCSSNCTTPLSVDSAHQPSLAYLPYLISGDYFYLEELWFWANFNMLQATPAYREFGKGLVKWDQLRGAAWSLRTLGHAAYITPDSSNMKSYFNSKLKNNLDWYNTTYSNNPNANKLGWVARLIDDSPTPYQTSPWMDDFFTWSVGHLNDLGFADALPLSNFKAKFPVGRMTDPGWCWIEGAVYHMVVNNKATGNPLPDFASAWPLTIQEGYPSNYTDILKAGCASPEMATALGLSTGEMAGYSQEASGFVAQLGVALATAVDLGYPKAQEAWTLFLNRPKAISRSNYAINPQWAIIPRTTINGGGGGGGTVGADLMIPSLTGPSTASTGANLNYAVSLQNQGGQTASSARLIFTLPTISSFVSSSCPQATLNGSTLTCTFGNLATTTSVSAQVVLKANTAGTATLIVNTSADNDIVSTNNQRTFTTTITGTTVTDSLATLTAGHWIEIPNSKLQAVFPNPTPPGNTGPRSVMDAWSGGAYDSKRNRLIAWGGGHQDYSGNEIYVFDMQSYQWQRLTEPSLVVCVAPLPGDTSGLPCTEEPTGYYTDGTPRSRHTYTAAQYVPAIDRFCLFGAFGMYPNGQIGTKNVDCFNFDTLKWSRMADGYGAGMSAVDSSDGTVYSHTNNGGQFLTQFQPATNSWKALGNMWNGPAFFNGTRFTAAIDPIHHKLVAIGGNEMWAWDLDKPDANGFIPFHSITSTGAKEMVSVIGPGLEWDPITQKIIAWHGGSDVYSLDTTTWVWSKISAASNNTVTPPPGNSNGTWGRFRYMPAYNAFIAVNQTSENVFVYKLTDAAGTAQPPKADVKITTVTGKRAIRKVLTPIKFDFANAGPNNATGVQMAISLPAGLSNVMASSNTASCTVQIDKVTCSQATLGAGQTASVTISFVAMQLGTFHNTATISAQENDPDTLNNSRYWKLVVMLPI